MIRTLLVSICLAASSAAVAKDAQSGSPMENASGSAQAGGMQAGMVGSAKLDDSTSFGGVGKQEAASAAGGPCVYKAVMTDAEIATCRAANKPDTKRSATHRRKK
jgi:hypothetical protein